MKIEYDRGAKHLLDGNRDTVIVSGVPAGPYNIFSSLGLRQLPVNERVLSIKEKFFKHFEVVDNIVYFEHYRQEKEFFAYQQCYKSKKHDYYILISPNISEDDATTKYDFKSGDFRLDYVYFDGEDMALCNKMTKELNDCFLQQKGDEAVIFVVLKTMSGFEFKRKKIKPLAIDIDKMYNDDFRPVYDHVVETLRKTGEEGKGIILFHGAAGTGKTNLIKNLTIDVPDKKFIYITQSMIAHLDDPSFISGLIENKGSVLVLEDCETYLKDRKEGNNVISSLLNLSDGILSDVLELQIIATFNADIENIDSALLRKGRLIAEYDFGPLDIEKAKRIAEENNIEGEINKPMTVAEIFNMNDGASTSQKERRAIGFGVK
jgi:hypothetical protein